MDAQLSKVHIGPNSYLISCAKKCKILVIIVVILQPQSPNKEHRELVCGKQESITAILTSFHFAVLSAKDDTSISKIMRPLVMNCV